MQQVKPVLLVPLDLLVEQVPLAHKALQGKLDLAEKLEGQVLLGPLDGQVQLVLQVRLDVLVLLDHLDLKDSLEPQAEMAELEPLVVKVPKVPQDLQVTQVRLDPKDLQVQQAQKDAQGQQVPLVLLAHRVQQDPLDLQEELALLGRPVLKALLEPLVMKDKQGLQVNYTKILLSFINSLWHACDTSCELNLFYTLDIAKLRTPRDHFTRTYIWQEIPYLAVEK